MKQPLPKIISFYDHDQIKQNSLNFPPEIIYFWSASADQKTSQNMAEYKGLIDFCNPGCCHTCSLLRKEFCNL